MAQRVNPSRDGYGYTGSVAYTRRCSLLPMQSVLIVDESTETRTVLRTALENPERRVFEASAADEALRLAHQFHPTVIVLDLEIDRSLSQSPDKCDVALRPQPMSGSRLTASLFYGREARNDRVWRRTDRAKNLAKSVSAVPKTTIELDCSDSACKSLASDCDELRSISKSRTMTVGWN